MIDGNELAMNFTDVGGACCAIQAFAQQGQHFAIGAAPLAGIFKQHHALERTANQTGLLADVFIAPVPSAADDHAAALGR